MDKSQVGELSLGSSDRCDSGITDLSSMTQDHSKNEEAMHLRSILNAPKENIEDIYHDC